MAATEPLDPAAASGGKSLKKTADEATQRPGLLGRFLGFITCRRRAQVKQDASASPPGYEALRDYGAALTQKEKDEFKQMAWWSQAQTKMGARVFILAPRGPGGDTECFINMWGLLAYTVCEMHEHVVDGGELFAVAWMQFSDHRIWPFSALVFKKHLHPKYARCLDAVHVVHPSWTVRILRLVLWPFASDEFWDQFQSHERVEFLEPIVSLKALQLPKDIYKYDEYLDKKAEEMSKEAAKQMGQHSGGLGSSLIKGSDQDTQAESKKYKQQMQDIKKLLEEKGYGESKRD
jgi:hypothetical protein